MPDFVLAILCSVYDKWRKPRILDTLLLIYLYYHEFTSIAVVSQSLDYSLLCQFANIINHSDLISNLDSNDQYFHTFCRCARYVVHIPDNLPLDAAAPLLCAGITVYSPMKQHDMLQPGKKLGVVGLGGLGHVAVKFGKAFGMHVTVISTSPSKEEEAKHNLGADDFLISTNSKQMQVKFLHPCSLYMVITFKILQLYVK